MAILMLVAEIFTYFTHLTIGNISQQSTVKPRNTGPKSNGNPPITNAKPWSLQVISFNFLYWQ